MQLNVTYAEGKCFRAMVLWCRERAGTWRSGGFTALPLIRSMNVQI